MREILLATHNDDKVKEFAALLKPLGVEIAGAKDYRLIEPAETGETFQANAAIKARAAYSATGLPSLADDSGICVEALNGQPGLFTADWAGHPRNWLSAMQKVENLLQEQGAENRRAYFICVLCFIDEKGNEHFFEGRVNGKVTWPPRGDKGFGFDPVFVPEGYKQSFGELSEGVKNRLSHRALAARQFLGFLQHSVI
ncbi:MAG: RdgB/HAM1 family non-canonical purine NTP pyrophosphatase [Dongiaceae bacterium]